MGLDDGPGRVVVRQSSKDQVIYAICSGTLRTGFCQVALAGALAWPQVQPSSIPKPPTSFQNVLVLSGGTVVDVTQWGHSANDLQDSVVIVTMGVSPM